MRGSESQTKVPVDNNHIAHGRMVSHEASKTCRATELLQEESPPLTQSQAAQFSGSPPLGWFQSQAAQFSGSPPLGWFQSQAAQFSGSPPLGWFQSQAAQFSGSPP